MRAARVELAFPVWKTRVLPLDDASTCDYSVVKEWHRRTDSNRLNTFWRRVGLPGSPACSIVLGWLTGFEPANNRFTAGRSPGRASATPQRSNGSVFVMTSTPPQTYAAERLLGASPRTRTVTARIQAGCTASRAREAHVEDRTGVEPVFPAYQAGGLAADLPTQSGAGNRARTGTFSLTRRAHCHSCSASMADVTGLEPATARETTECPAFGPHVQTLGCWPGNRTQLRPAYETGAWPLG